MKDAAGVMMMVVGGVILILGARLTISENEGVRGFAWPCALVGAPLAACGYLVLR